MGIYQSIAGHVVLQITKAVVVDSKRKAIKTMQLLMTKWVEVLHFANFPNPEKLARMLTKVNLSL